MNPHSIPSTFDAGTSPRGQAADTSSARARLQAAFSARRVAYRTAELREAGFGERAIHAMVQKGTLLRLHSFATLTTSARG